MILAYLKFKKDKRLSSLKELKLPKIPKKYMIVFNKNYLNKKCEITTNDNEKTINKKRIIQFLFETGIRCSEINNIIKVNKDTITILGKGNKRREIFHNWNNTRLINFINVTSKTIRIWVKEILGNH